MVDEQQRPAHFILTGSQQFGLMSGITQSLAGRVALLNLLPFSASELRQANLLPPSPDAPGNCLTSVHSVTMRA